MLVLVAAQAQFGGEAVGLIAMLDECRAVPATVFVERRAAVDPILIPIAAEHQAVALVECQVVLPVHRVAVGVEHAAFIAEFVQRLLAVFAVAEFDAGIPRLVDPGVDVAADTADIEFVVGLLLIRTARDVVVTAERTIKLALATVLQHVGADFDIVVQGMAQAQAERFVAVRVMVAITRIRLVGAVDSGGFIKAGAEVEAGLFIATGQAEAALPRLVAANADMKLRSQPGFAATAGENLDHPANCIAAINHRTGAAQHFHALDLFDVDVLQVAVAGGRAADALAVHQHQALRRLSATNVDSRQTAASAALCHLNARHATQQVGDAVGLQAVDVFAGEHGIGGTAVVARFDLTVGTDQHVGQFQGLIAFEGVGQQGAGWQQGQRQGEAEEIHSFFVETQEYTVPVGAGLPAMASLDAPSSERRPQQAGSYRCGIGVRG
ncbi:hypothetical protein D3C84_613420 [compost metagenome]